MGKLNYLMNPIFLSNGTDDNEGFQIFTPDSIVLDMINSIGKKEILDFSKTILEPTSGDGAFTCRILEMRLNSIKKENAGLLSLMALSTIYSIEIDEELIKKQRDNIFTIMMNFAKKHNIQDEKYYKTLEEIIMTNFVWAMTNYEDELFSLFGVSIAYKMPYALDGTIEPVAFYKWKINEDYSFEKIEEEIEL